MELAAHPALVALAVGVLLLLAVAMLAATWRMRAGCGYPLRPIAAYARLERLVHRAAESGRALMVHLGAGALGGASTSETLMGLTVLGQVARRAAFYRATVMGVCADGVAWAAALGALRRAGESSPSAAPDGEALRWVGPDALTYAVGASAALMAGPQSPLASVVWGRIGPEALLLTDATARQGMAQLGGAAEPLSAAALAVSLDGCVLGEDLYAAGAYLGRNDHLGSLAAQDLIRAATILALLVGAVLASLGAWG